MESIEEKMMDSDTTDKSDNVPRADNVVTAKCNSPKKPMGNRAEDRLNEKVIDEEYRRTAEVLMKGYADLPKNWNDMTVREQRDWLASEGHHAFTNMPKSLVFLCTGAAQAQQCDRSLDDPKPEWYDQEKFLRGQRFAMKHWGSVSFSELLSLYVLFSFENGLKPMIVTGRSSDPFQSFKRYLSTSERIKSWYTSDPWTKGTRANRDMETVRKMHSVVRENLFKMSLDEIDEASKIDNAWCTTRETLREDFRQSCPAPVAGQCPFVFAKTEQFKRTKGLTQGDMAATQGGFVGFVILFPEYLGIHGCSDDDLDAFCHVWRCIGYLLGIEDEYNFCNGTLDEVKQRMRDFLDYWVKPNFREITPEWEHMLRCIIEGMQYYIPKMTYEQGLLYLMYLLDIRVPRFTATMSYPIWFRYQIMKITFYWTARFSNFSVGMNLFLKKSVDRALNFTKEELAILQEKSQRTLAKGIKESNDASRRCSESMISKFWRRASPTLIFFSTCLLLNLSIVKDFTTKLYIDANARLLS